MKSRHWQATVAVGLTALLAAPLASASYIYHFSQEANAGTANARVNLDVTFSFDQPVVTDSVMLLSDATQVLINSFNTFNRVEIDLDTDDRECNRQSLGSRCDVIRFLGSDNLGSTFGFVSGDIVRPGTYSQRVGQFTGTLVITDTQPTNQVPEPSTWALSGLALGALGWLQRRRVASRQA